MGKEYGCSLWASASPYSPTGGHGVGQEASRSCWSWGDPKGSSDGSNSSNDCDKGRRPWDPGIYSDDDEVVRQGKGYRARGSIVPSRSSSSTSDGIEDKGKVDCIDAVKKGRRLLAFSLVPVVEKRSTRRQGRDVQE